MGSLLVMNSIRFEAKHQIFKRFSKTKNFKNINFSIAQKHQRSMAGSMKTYSSKNKIQVSKKSGSVDLNDQFEYDVLENQPVQEIQWLQFNDRRFRSGFLILSEGHMYEIMKILAVENSFFFLCVKVSFVSVENELSSVKITKYITEVKKIIKYSSDII